MWFRKKAPIYILAWLGSSMPTFLQASETRSRAPLAGSGGRAYLKLLEAQDRLAEGISERGVAEGLTRALGFTAVYLHPGQPLITGRGSIQAFLEETYPEPEAGRESLNTLAGGVSADGLLGFTFGWTENPIGETSVYGRFIAVWRRSLAGWRIHAYLRRESTRSPDAVPTDARLPEGIDPQADWGLPEASAMDAAAADSAFAELSIDEGYTVAFVANAHPAAVVFNGDDILWNRERIAEGFGGWTPDQTLRWAPLRSESTLSGDMAWSVGHSTFLFTDSEGITRRSLSKYLTIWIRSSDGTWSYLVDGGSPGR